MQNRPYSIAFYLTYKETSLNEGAETSDEIEGLEMRIEINFFLSLSLQWLPNPHHILLWDKMKGHIEPWAPSVSENINLAYKIQKMWLIYRMWSKEGLWQNWMEFEVFHFTHVVYFELSEYSWCFIVYSVCICAFQIKCCIFVFSKAHNSLFVIWKHASKVLLSAFNKDTKHLWAYLIEFDILPNTIHLLKKDMLFFSFDVFCEMTMVTFKQKILVYSSEYNLK